MKSHDAFLKPVQLKGVYWTMHFLLILMHTMESTAFLGLYKIPFSMMSFEREPNEDRIQMLLSDFSKRGVHKMWRENFINVTLTFVDEDKLELVDEFHSANTPKNTIQSLPSRCTGVKVLKGCQRVYAAIRFTDRDGDGVHQWWPAFTYSSRLDPILLSSQSINTNLLY